MKKRKQKTRRARRERLTHFEVRRGGSLLLKISIAEDLLVESDVGAEIASLIAVAAPGSIPNDGAMPLGEALPSDDDPQSEDFVVSPDHPTDDEAYHADLRGRLAALVGALCDTALDDALEIVRQERARRADGGN